MHVLFFFFFEKTCSYYNVYHAMFYGSKIYARPNILNLSNNLSKKSPNSCALSHNNSSLLTLSLVELSFCFKTTCQVSTKPFVSFLPRKKVSTKKSNTPTSQSINAVFIETMCVYKTGNMGVPYIYKSKLNHEIKTTYQKLSIYHGQIYVGGERGQLPPVI